MIFSTMNREVKLTKITGHQDLNMLGILRNIKEYFWGSRQDAREFLGTVKFNKSGFKGTS